MAVEPTVGVSAVMKSPVRDPTARSRRLAGVVPVVVFRSETFPAGS
jgi:hypothetical protein